MKYMGSKSRIAKDIIPIIQNYIDTYNISTYCEPFAGGMNIIDKIKAECKLATDNNKYLIELFKNREKVITDLPDICTKELYDSVRNSYNNNTDEYEDWFKGAIGFFASYNGRFFSGGFNGAKYLRGEEKRCFYDEARRNFIEQIPRLDGIDFGCADYTYLKEDTCGNLIYCDIPYYNTKKYDTSKNFDYEKFWDWCRKLSVNNIVLISEQTAPNDFECIWEQEVNRSIKAMDKSKATEKLFIWKEKQL